jgi:hypothetical protein
MIEVARVESLRAGYGRDSRLPGEEESISSSRFEMDVADVVDGGIVATVWSPIRGAFLCVRRESP